jgi:hypothetical protein
LAIQVFGQTRRNHFNLIGGMLGLLGTPIAYAASLILALPATTAYFASSTMSPFA